MQKKSLKKEKSTYKVFRKLVKLDEKIQHQLPKSICNKKKVNTQKSYKNNITHAVKKYIQMFHQEIIWTHTSFLSRLSPMKSALLPGDVFPFLVHKILLPTSTTRAAES